ncbi:hypothetical protein H072_4656 [Dactylellina haptotyla CBS 200.50]|uniref:Uncharacterized protein n=1 Tax=Dactylellina haptotyla (strain CBS 200.50) TaxID=1284197 RepID=S8AJX7_DACHA|nr:hypothetical protein H072_4656 [Dactylellina haptotyla CBS 200.50]
MFNKPSDAISEDAYRGLEPSSSPFFPPLSPYKSSSPIPDEFLKGYYSRIEPRFNSMIHAEESAAIRASETEWIARGGCTFRGGAFSPAGSIISITLPECIHKKASVLLVSSSSAFIEDDIIDGELFVNFHESSTKFIDEDSPEYKAQRSFYRVIIDQIRARQYVDLLNQDGDGNAYVQSLEDWHNRSWEVLDLESQNKQNKSLEEYLDSRLATLGSNLYLMLVPFCFGFQLTPQEYELLEPLNSLVYKLCNITNDLESAVCDWIAHASYDKPDIPGNCVYIIMRDRDVSLGEARDILLEMFRVVELEAYELCQKLLESPPSANVKVYLENILLVPAGVVAFGINSSRYKANPEHPLYPPLQAKLKGLPRVANTKHALNSVIELYSETSKDSTRGVNRDISAWSVAAMPQKNPKPWLSEYPQLTEQVVMEPCEYIASMPSKKVRKAMIRALDSWYLVPHDSMEIITNIIDLLHTSSLIIDDIENNSPLRRGRPAAHMAFGMPQSVNAANYLFVKCLEEVQKLSPAAIHVYTEELRNLHIGQGTDLHWTFHGSCPSEAEYIRMIDGKTGGLFRMACRLMKADATKNHNLDANRLFTVMGRFFQIRDDYQNLTFATYSTAKGELSDLDEGKYSFMLIRALNNGSNTFDSKLKNLLQLRSRQGYLTPEQKILAMRCMTRSKSMEYTFTVIKELEAEVERILESLESSVGEHNWTIRAIMARLRTADPKMAYISQ